jgi:hypothetical protein
MAAFSSTVIGATAFPCIEAQLNHRAQDLGSREKLPPVIAPRRWHHSDLSEKFPSQITDLLETERAKVMDADRFKRATILLNTHSQRQSQALSHLSDGTYIYLFDEKGSVAIVDRVMDPGAGESLADPRSKYIGSHAGLAGYLGYLFKRPPKVVAAGEIVVRNGRVMAISNGSGTYRGSAVNLKFAVEKFHDFGLRLDAKTNIADYSKLPRDPHVGAAKIVRSEIRVIRNPAFRRLVNATRDVMTYVDHNLDDTTVISSVLNANHRLTPDEQKLISPATKLTDYWFQFQEGTAERVQFILNEVGEQNYWKILKILRESIPQKHEAHGARSG